ncbi:Hypothetical protein A7982_03412 [Minicystis rosea]|nr:Hypothetical protein A7982_03412 [Minicystis rosea]
MHRLLSRAAARSSALAGAILLTTGCITGVNVGQDALGGSTTTTTTTDAPTGASCKSPAALLCPWGKAGGPCGGNKPNKKDCDSEHVCVGATADTEGTCVLPGASLALPGDACGAGVPEARPCPWNYACDAPIAPDGVGTCAPSSCVLGDGSPIVSEASITVDGDGPTQHHDFGCSLLWGANITGEAGAYITHHVQPPSAEWLYINGCQSPDGDEVLGSLRLMAPITGVGTTTASEADYRAANAGNYLTSAATPASVTVTAIDADRVRGSYDVTVEGLIPGDTKHLTGTFDVCRLPYHYPN